MKNRTMTTNIGTISKRRTSEEIFRLQKRKVG